MRQQTAANIMTSTAAAAGTQQLGSQKQPQGNQGGSGGSTCNGGKLVLHAQTVFFVPEGGFKFVPAWAGMRLHAKVPIRPKLNCRDQAGIVI